MTTPPARPPRSRSLQPSDPDPTVASSLLLSSLAAPASFRDLDFYTGRDVNYCCGFCGYDLNLSSCYRNTRKIGSKYGKAIKKGIITFSHIDESKFTQKEDFSCRPYISKSSWGIFQRRTRLMCRKCRNHIGDGYPDYDSIDDATLQKSDYAYGGRGPRRKYKIKISSIQPSSGCSTPLLAP